MSKPGAWEFFSLASGGETRKLKIKGPPEVGRLERRRRKVAPVGAGRKEGGLAVYPRSPSLVEGREKMVQ